MPSSIWGAGLVSFVAAAVALGWQLRVTGDRLVVRWRPRPGITLVRAAREPPTPAPAVAGEQALVAGEPASAAGRAVERSAA